MTNRPDATKDAVLELSGISLSYPGVQALQDVDLALYPGQIHALVGENGAGKTSLIHVLSGVTQADSGEIRSQGKPIRLAEPGDTTRIGIVAVHQDTDLVLDLTVAENMALEYGWPTVCGVICWSRLRVATRAALQSLQVNIDAEVLAETLTASERQLLGLAGSLAQPATVLVLDEPTASLSAAETQILFNQLRTFREKGGTILYVSHRLEEVFELADVVTVLRDGRRVWHGPIATIDTDRLIAAMVGRSVPGRGIMRARVKAKALLRPLLTCTGLTAVDGSFCDVTLEVRPGEILGLYGLVGAGRTEWAQSLLGLRRIAAGSLTLHGKPWTPSTPGHAARSGVAYLPEDRLKQSLFRSLSVRLNTVLPSLAGLRRGPFIQSRKEYELSQSWIRRLAIRLRSDLQPVGTLSGGNQQKVVLARWLARKPDVLILDEPTLGVDVGAREEIYTLLRELKSSGCAVVLISSDLPEVLAQSDRIGVFTEGRLAAEFSGEEAKDELVGAAALPIHQASDTVVEPKPMSLAFTNQAGWQSRLGTCLRVGGPWLAVLAISVLLGLRTDGFFLAATLRDLAESIALTMLCGLAASLVIMVGGIDISFGSTMALSAAVAGCLFRIGWPPALAVGIALLTGMACGGGNALVALVGRLHPIVVTLGTLSAYRGLTRLLIGGRAIHDVPDSFRLPFQDVVLGIPASLLVSLLIVGLAWFWLGWTVAGRESMAQGSNPTVAARVGIRRWRIWLKAFSLQGLLAGLAGTLALAQTGHLQSTDFEDKTLEAIGVAVVGGIRITGGRGSVLGVCGAAVLFRLLDKAWVFLQVPGYWQKSVVGIMLLGAILADQLMRRATATHK